MDSIEKKRYLAFNPMDGIDFLPVEKKVKYVPEAEDIDKVISSADPDTQDYLWVIRETMGRMSEINRLVWNDVNSDQRYVILIYAKEERGTPNPEESADDR